MTDIVTKANKLNNDLVEVNREIKRVASIKCRLKKMPGRKTYNEEMNKVLQEEQLLKNVRDYLQGPRKNVNTVTQEEVDNMDYDEVCRAIRSIQSKKTHTKYADDCLKDEKGMYIPASGESYKEACRIEDMLITRRNEIKPVSEGHVRKSDLFAYIEQLRLCSDLDVDTCLGKLTEYVENT